MVVPSISRASHQARASTVLRIRVLVLCSLAGMRYAARADSRSSYASFSEPDGNVRLLQEITEWPSAGCDETLSGLSAHRT